MSSSIISRLHGKPIIYGEVLFDIFSDGRKVLGGAPFNVAWHLQGFDLAPLVISRIGQDVEGQNALDAMEDWGLDTHGIQRDAVLPTGGVEITMQESDHHFDIRADQAYDYIDYQPLMESTHDQQLSLIYLGSLIMRNQTSRETLERLLGEKHLPVFVDINLRDPWWDAATVNGLLSQARWAKLNNEELAAIVPGTVHSEEGLIRAANEALLRFGLDAFCVVTLFGLHAGWPATEIIERALTFAAEICKQRGAISPNRELYGNMVASWGPG